MMAVFVVCGFWVAPAYAEAVDVPEDSYVTFSTVYGGKRYYLCADTMTVNSVLVDTIKASTEPSHKAMWKISRQDGDYATNPRSIKSVWLEDKQSRVKYLSLGVDKGTYNALCLRDEANKTLWRASNDELAKNKYLEGYVYYFSDATGIDVYRYVTYDPLFGFSRTFSSRPGASFRVTIWDRKTGNDLLFTFAPVTHTFGLEMNRDTTILPVTSKVTYYKDVDRFRSRDGKVDVFAKTPTIITDPTTLTGEPYYLYGYYEWKSNPRTSAPTFGEDTYDGASKMRIWGTRYVLKEDATEPYDAEDYDEVPCWMDSTVMAVRIEKFQKGDDGLWHDTLYAIGTSPFDVKDSVEVDSKWVPGTTYRDHSDWLYIHFTCEGQNYTDSALLVRQTFRRDPYTTVTLKSTPEDYTFPYKSTYTGEPAVSAESDTAKTFVVSGRYTAGGRILYANGTVAQTIVGETGDVDIEHLEPETLAGRTYNVLRVEALMANGKSAIVGADGADANAWIESVRLTDKDEVRVKVKPFETASTKSRSAQLRISYNFLHSTALGDTALSVRNIWITQAGKSGAGVFSFNHKGNVDEPQQVHTVVQDLYGIPGEALPLPVHRDHWGYYRWYQWDYRGDGHEVAVNNNTWSWVTMPQNNHGDDLMPINTATNVTSRGHWDIGKGHYADHYTVGTPTPIPTIAYPAETALDFVDSIACDVSAYTDITVVSPTITPAADSSVTEPTLSYRNIFAVHHASVRADEMSHCRVAGTGEDNKWMEKHNVVVPAGRTFSLNPRYPVNDNDEGIDEGQLQYIYYFNSANMGTAGDLNKQAAASYNRIGRAKYASGRTSTLLTRARINSMPDTTLNVVMVNPRKGGSGYVLGYKSATEFSTQQAWIKDATNKTMLDAAIQSKVVAANQSYYLLTMTKKGGKITISYGSTPLYLNQESLFSSSWHIGWGKGSWVWSGNQWDYPDITSKEGWSTANLIDATLADNVVSLYIEQSAWLGIVSTKGYLNACTFESSVFTPNPNFVDGNPAGDWLNAAWVFYEVKAPGELLSEQPEWQIYNTGTSSWTKVADETNANNAAGYTMKPDGSLEISESVLLAANETIQYQLVTDHFQLAQFTVVTRDVDVEGPSERAIIPEETLINDYDILLDFNSKGFTPPSGSAAQSAPIPMDWNHSEMSYHDNSVSTANRVNTSFLPAKGEYAFINKFELDGKVVESMAGAEYGFMLCTNASEKPVVMMTFEYDNPPCSDQEVFLTGDLCNPVQNAYEPEITADLEGWNGSAWVPVYRYKTGAIPYNAAQPWYQFVLPLEQSKIAGFSKFRCTAKLAGSTEEQAYMLMDRLRFVAKARPLTVFQNKSTCLSGSSVEIVARLDYRNSGMKPGTLVAYQYQKLNTSTGKYDPLSVTYVNDAGVGSLTDIDDAACGAVSIPAADFTPAPADTATYEDLLPGRCYINEGTAASKYWVMMLSHTVNEVSAGDRFRVAMTVIPNADTKPNFSTLGCAAERILTIKNPVSLQIDSKPWKNASRTEAKDTLKNENTTYRLNVKVSPEAGTNPRCKFDILRSYEWDRDYEAKVKDWKKAIEDKAGEETIAAKKDLVDKADSTFKVTYGVTRNQLMEILEIFRADNEDNPLREETNWNNVRKEDFLWSGRSMEQVTRIYDLLNTLIASRTLQIGLDYLDIYLGNNEDAYYYVQPMPATGVYETTVDAKTVLVHFPVCNTPQWFEIHSKAPVNTYTLRFGYDSKTGETYRVPVIRASQTTANSTLPVRVAEMITSNHTDTILLGWESTHVVETNDPAWVNGTSKFYYRQDIDAHGKDLSSLTYYAKGENVQFAKVTDGTNTSNFDLHPGYWYTFETTFYSYSKTGTYPSGTTEGTLAGTSKFILAVAPDTALWNPSHPESANYWNDDDNWFALNGDGDTIKDCIATIPMGDTKVIIPAPTQENMLPIVNSTVVRRVDTLDFGFVANTCKEILFKPHARMLGQENLDYTRAFVDEAFKSSVWYTYSPALQEIYAGDMYIPEDTTAAYDKDFAPGRFENADGAQTGSGKTWSASINREYPWGVYQRFYNTTVKKMYQNTDIDGAPLSYHEQTSAEWMATNMMDRLLPSGNASVIAVFGSEDDDEAKKELVVRLPKQETSYHYIGLNGRVGTEETMTGKHSLAALEHNLSFDKTLMGDNDYVAYPISNSVSSDLFFFGNPSLALIDVYTLCEDNCATKGGGLANKVGGKYTVYELVDGTSAYITREVSAAGQYYLAPHRAIGLKASTAGTSLTVNLKPDALRAMTGSGEVARAPRRNRQQADSEPKYLYVSASNETSDGVHKAFLKLGEEARASRGYVAGEDALVVTSGVTENGANAFQTPLSMYTIADNQALMLDIRDTLGSVPVAFTRIDDQYDYSNVTYLSFATSGNWDTPLYLYDAVTNDSVLIMNGLQVGIETPMKDQVRYFINVRNVKTAEQSGVPTDLGQTESGEKEPLAGQTAVYDIMGRKVMTLSEYTLLDHVRLPQGVYIIQRGNTTERRVVR